MSRRNHENDTHVDSSSGRAQNTRGAQQTHDAMVRKARAGHVTGGRVYGYDNIEILSGLLDAYGRPKRDHVEQRVNQEQAAVVRRIFMLCAAGKGMVSIARLLNDEKDARRRAIVRAGGYCGLETHTSLA